jgi:hypothetical protein
LRAESGVRRNSRLDPERSITVTLEQGYGVAKEMRDDEVGDIVAGHVAGRNAGDIRTGGVADRGFEGAVTIADEDGDESRRPTVYRVRGGIGEGKIGEAVLVEVEDGEAPRDASRREDGLRLERSVAFTEQDENGGACVAATAHSDEVELAIIVKI